jgi:hypothetical protein
MKSRKSKDRRRKKFEDVKSGTALSWLTIHCTCSGVIIELFRL